MIRSLIVALLLVGSAAGGARAECPPFHDSLDDVDSILDNGGQISGTLSFAPGVNGQAVVLSGGAAIRYPGSGFAASGGTVAMWFKKSSGDTSGGIAQIGQIGAPSSLGLFYNNQNDLYFEVRGAADGVSQILAGDSLPAAEFIHLAATWQNLGNAVVTKLFINGRFLAYAILEEAFHHEAAYLDVGVTGYYGFAQGAADEVVFLDWPANDSEIYAEYVVSSNRHVHHPTAKPPSTGPVRIEGRSLRVQGRPFQVRGVGYQPVPIGAWPSREVLDALYTDPCILARDIPLLRQMKVNTVRFWSQLPDSELLLDALYNNGDEPIYAIMGFWVPQTGIDYSDPDTITEWTAAFRDYVSRFKDHPAVLAWGIGNENNLVYPGALSDWYTLANLLAGAAYAEEGPAYHPTLIINAGLLDSGNVDLASDDATLDNVDAWGINAYFGDDAHCYFDYYERLSAKPLIITEYGIDAFDMISGAEYQNTQAEWVTGQWRQIREQSGGGTVMAYSDEWWKADHPFSHDLGGYGTDMHPDGYSNEEWWGMVAVVPGPDCDVAIPRQVYADLGGEFALDACAARGDLDRSGLINPADLALLLGSWGACAPQEACPADLTGNAGVGAEDLAILLGHWGACN